MSADLQFRKDLVDLVPRLRRFAYSLCGSMPDADDLVQAACERALKSADQFQPGTRMEGWMFRIVQNLWLDQRRRTRVRGDQVDPDDIGLSDQGRGASLPQDRLMLEQTRAAMATLPEAQRAVLALVAIEGQSYRDAAETLGVPVGTVMSRLARARETLLPLLGLSKGPRQ